MDNFAEQAQLEHNVDRAMRRQWFNAHLVCFAGVQLVLYVVWRSTPGTHPWFLYPLFGWGAALAAHAYLAFVARTRSELLLEKHHAARD